jgi:hypothetical protein
VSDFVRVVLLDEYLYDHTKLGDGTLLGAIAKLNELAAMVPSERLASVRFEFEDRGYNETSMHLKIWYDRPKTTTELVAEEAKRTEQARQYRLRIEAEEREVLAKLKEKYGE